MAEGGGPSLKDQGNEFFKAGNFLKAAALYTQAIKLDPSNPTLYRFAAGYCFGCVLGAEQGSSPLYCNRATAFLHLVNLSTALADAETTITLKPEWEKGYFRKGWVLEAMERYDDAVAAFQVALQYNPQSAEVSKKIRRLTQLVGEKKRAKEVENIRSSIDMGRYLDPLKAELVRSQYLLAFVFEGRCGKIGPTEESQDIFSFAVDTMESAIKV